MLKDIFNIIFVRKVLSGAALLCCILFGVNAPGGIAEAGQSDAYNQAEANSIQGIVGIWHQEDVTDEVLLTVNPDSTYKLIAGDGHASYGTVHVTYDEHPDGTKSYWYVFNENDGTFWAGFTKNEKESTQTDMWSGHEGYIHFSRNYGDAFHATSKGVAPEEYLGVWGCGRCTVVISNTVEGYLADISWASSAAEYTRWSYPCIYDTYNAVLVCPDQGLCLNCVTSEDGVETCTEVYHDGAAVFVMRDGILTWHDKKNNSGNAMEFRH
ncbi:MAG: hypothetical protein K6C05_02610 [Anaerovibrio sp.]|uniref:hypothetical protein n=1 Tax=Anaerovibrio sp. TaxID=1872532 RepID=UPI0025CD7F31|nr:hypothetical protein [Anaerovibrio sp.]MCR5175722.1 hypothetical protein [Anaerovibrio sp.]